MDILSNIGHSNPYRKYFNLNNQVVELFETIHHCSILKSKNNKIIDQSIKKYTFPLKFDVGMSPTRLVSNYVLSKTI